MEKVKLKLKMMHDLVNVKSNRFWKYDYELKIYFLRDVAEHIHIIVIQAKIIFMFDYIP